MPNPRIQIILASTRDKRFGDKVAKWVESVAKQRGDMDVELLDLKEWNLPMFHGDPPSGGTYQDDTIKRWAEKIAQGDGYVIVTPEYNHGYPAPLKNALDCIYHEWKYKAAGLVSYGGGAGGARAAEQLRLVLAELHVASVREALVLPGVWSQFDESGKPKDPSMDKRLNVVLADLLWWATALKEARAKTPR